MNNETLQMLTALAEKLGTTAEYLLGVLVKQAPISGVLSLLFMIFWISATVFWFSFVKKKTTDDDWYGDGVFFAWASVFILGVISICVSTCAIESIASAFLNPEYWALNQLFQNLQK